MSGAQRNFRLYARKVSAKAVTALFVMPFCARRVVSVAPIIANGKPEEIPRNSAASGAGSRYGRMPSLQRVVIVYGERRVVGEAPVLVDRAALRRVREARRSDLVVDAPAHVLRPRLPAIRPPRVLVGAAIDAAKR